MTQILKSHKSYLMKKVRETVILLVNRNRHLQNMVEFRNFIQEPVERRVIVLSGGQTFFQHFYLDNLN